MIRKAVLITLLLLPTAAIWAQTPGPALKDRATTVNGRVSVVRDDHSIVVQEKRIDLDIDNASLADAVKVLAEKAGETVEIDSRVASDKRVTLRIHNVTFGTALRLLTEAAGAGVTMNLTDGKMVFRLTKSPIGQGNSFFVAPRLSLELHGQDHVTATVPQGMFTFTSPAVGPDGILTLPPTLYKMRMEELRSTFTCPHCKGQVTALRSRQEPKCPKCGRPFQGDWQFCPADGTKRPAVSTDWRYCPLCGHRVEIEKRSPEEPAK